MSSKQFPKCRQCKHSNKDYIADFEEIICLFDYRNPNKGCDKYEREPYQRTLKEALDDL